MKNIQFSESEIREIKEHYSQELEKLNKKVAEIRSVLNKFESESKKENKPVEKVKLSKPAGKLARTTKDKTSLKSEEKPNSIIAEKAASKGQPKKIKSGKKLKAVSVKGKKTGDRKKVVVAVKKNANSVAKQKVAKPALKAKKGKKPVAKKVVAAAKVAVKKETKKPVAKGAKKAAVKSVAKSTKKSTASTAKKVAAKSVKKPVAKASKKASKTKKKSEGSVTKKSKWTSFIVEYLGKQNQLLSSKPIIDAAMQEFKIPAKDYSKIRSTVAGSLSDLVLETKRLKTIPQVGKKGNLYGLIQWFDDKGSLIDPTKMK